MTPNLNIQKQLALLQLMSNPLVKTLMDNVQKTKEELLFNIIKECNGQARRTRTN